MSAVFALVVLVLCNFAQLTAAALRWPNLGGPIESVIEALHPHSKRESPAGKCDPQKPVDPYPHQSLSIPTVGTHPEKMTCRVAPWLTAKNIDQVKNDPAFIGWLAELCGKNRGIYTLAGEGYFFHTFSCADFPEPWGGGDLAHFVKSNSGETFLKYLNLFFQAVYNSSITKTAEACGPLGLSELNCGLKKPSYKTVAWSHMLDSKPMRGVNIGGLFVLEPWITAGIAKWDFIHLRDQLTYSEAAANNKTMLDKLKSHWKTWYTQDDFDDMKKKGLNVVRLPVGWWYFAEEAGYSPDVYIVPDEKITDTEHPITKIIEYASKAGLKVLLDLHGAPGSQNGFDNSGNMSLGDRDLNGEWWLYDQGNQDKHVQIVKTMAKYIVETLPGFQLGGHIIGLELVNEPWVFLDMSMVRNFYFRAISEIRAMTKSSAAPSGGKLDDYSELPIIIHDAFRPTDWFNLLKHFDLYHVYMDAHVYHGFNTADVASDTDACDKQKQTIHQNIACAYGDMIRFATCTAVPTFVGEWSLVIDNCMGYITGARPNRIKPPPDAEHAGQCRPGNMAKRLQDPWWTKNIADFAQRQIAAWEKDLGWIFWTWKVDELSQTDPSSNFWSFKQAYGKYIVEPYNPQACNTPAPISPGCVESTKNRDPRSAYATSQKKYLEHFGH